MSRRGWRFEVIARCARRAYGDLDVGYGAVGRNLSIACSDASYSSWQSAGNDSKVTRAATDAANKGAAVSVYGCKVGHRFVRLGLSGARSRIMEPEKRGMGR